MSLESGLLSNILEHEDFRQITDLRTQKINEDTIAAESERRLRNQFFDQSFSFDEKLSSMELVIKERDQYIEGRRIRDCHS